MEKNITRDINTEGEEKFYIKTKLWKKEYRKLSYFNIFIRGRLLLKLIGLSLAAGIGVCLWTDSMSIGLIFGMALFYFVILFAIMMLKTEAQHKKVIKSDKLGIFNTLLHLRLYEDCIVVQRENIEGYTKFRYDQFCEVIESKIFYILYLTHNQMFVIRKVDVADTGNFSSFLKEKFSGKYSKG